MSQPSQFRPAPLAREGGVWPSLLPTPVTSALDPNSQLCGTAGSSNDGAWLEEEAE